jgi:SAM-dependent methyltransferase
MERILEPELMDDEAQAKVYAEADFSEPHDNFVSLFAEYYPDHPVQDVLDLGCGSADVILRFAKAYPNSQIDGIDGSAAMLVEGKRVLQKTDKEVAHRIRLLQRLLPTDKLPRPHYGTIIYNSLLHHLHPMESFDFLEVNPTKIF